MTGWQTGLLSDRLADFTLEHPASCARSWTVRQAPLDATLEQAVSPLWADQSNRLTIGVKLHPSDIYIVIFADIARFEINFETREIIVAPLGTDVGRNTLHHLLVDQILPRVIAQDGDLVLHAAGVATPKGAILLLGPSGRGKSTLAASLAQRGYPLLGDDAIIVSDRGCRAVYPSLRLFPDSIETLFDAAIAHSPVAHYSDKRNLRVGPDVDGGNEEHRVRAVFFLGEDGGAHSKVEAVPPSDACMLLVEHSFWLDPTDVDRTVRKFRAASALANRVPTYRLEYPRDYSRLAGLHTELLSVLA